MTANSQALWRPLVTDLIGPLSLVFSASIAQAHHAYYLNGDAIGSSSIITDNTGGFTAVEHDSATDLDGDFNANDVVDVADFVVWRRNLGAVTELSLNYAGDGLNGVDMGDYLLWCRNFGMTSKSAQGTSPKVPEPSSTVLLMFAVGGLVRCTTRSSSCNCLSLDDLYPI